MYQSARKLRIILMLSFFAVTGAVCIPAIFLILNKTHHTLVNEQSNHINYLVKSRTDQIKILLKARISNLNLVSSRTQLRLSMRSYAEDPNSIDYEKMVRILNDAKLSNSVMKHITLINTEGRTIASTEQKKVGLILISKDEYLNGKNKGKVHGVHDQDGTLTLSVTSPMLLDGKVIGIAWSEMTLEELEKIASDKNGLGQTGKVIIARETKEGNTASVIPTRLSSTEHSSTNKHKYFLDFISNAIKKGSHVSEFTDYRGKKVISAVDRIPQLNWTILAKIDQSETLEPVISEQYRILTILACLFIPFFILCAWLSKKLTHALYQTEEKNNLIIEAAGDAFLLIDKDGNIISANRATEKLSGYNRQDLIGKPATLLVDPTRREKLSKLLNKLCVSTFYRSIKQIELLGMTASGETVPMEISISQPKVSSDIKLIIIGRDVSKRWETEQKINEGIIRQNQLIETQKLFVNIASHEFRTPISMISNAVQHLERMGSTITQDYIFSKTGKIRFAVGRMLQLMERLLSLSNIEQGSFSLDIKSCNISDILTQTCSYHQDLAKFHTITLNIDSLPNFIKADAVTLEQIINNLIDNAVKYSPNNGNILISARETGDYIEIKIQDNGLGIEESEIPKLFERFFRSTNSVGISGTGIGLHLVKLLTEMHGGTISVASEKDVGSTFTLLLPISGPKQDSVQTEHAA